MTEERRAFIEDTISKVFQSDEYLTFDDSKEFGDLSALNMLGEAYGGLGGNLIVDASHDEICLLTDLSAFENWPQEKLVELLRGLHRRGVLWQDFSFRMYT